MGSSSSLLQCSGKFFQPLLHSGSQHHPGLCYLSFSLQIPLLFPQPHTDISDTPFMACTQRWNKSHWGHGRSRVRTWLHWGCPTTGRSQLCTAPGTASCCQRLQPLLGLRCSHTLHLTQYPAAAACHIVHTWPSPAWLPVLSALSCPPFPPCIPSRHLGGPCLARDSGPGQPVR